MKSMKTVRYHGIEIDQEAARMFRNTERRLRRAIDEGSYPCARHILGEIKADAGDAEDLQQVFEEIRKDATTRWQRTHGKIVSAERISAAIERSFKAEMEWLYAFSRDVDKSGPDALSEGLVMSESARERLQSLGEANDPEFWVSFKDLSGNAQSAWLDLVESKNALAAEVDRFLPG